MKIRCNSLLLLCVTVTTFSSTIFVGGCKKSDDTLRVYSSGDPAMLERIKTEFKKDTGIVMEYVRLSSGEALTRIRTEKGNPKATMWMIGPGIEYAVAAHEELFEKYQPKLEFEMPEMNRDLKWRWMGLYLGSVAFGTNKKFMEEKKVTPPRSWADLLKPEFKGRIAYAYPYTSGTSLTILLGLVKLMGEAPAFEYIKKLDRQVHQYSKSGSACVNQVGLGEIAVCVCFGHDILAKGVDKGYPIEITYPTEGTFYETTGVGLIKGGPDQEKGKKMIDWLVSVKGQTVLEEWHVTPFHPNVPVRPPGVSIHTIKLVDLDNEWVVANQKHLVEEWRKVTGK